MATLLLLGLDDASAEIISKLAIQAGHLVRRESMRITFETRPIEDVVVVSGERDTYKEVILSLRQFRAAPPVIVISRLGEASGWVEALETGASDYLAAPYTFAKVKEAIKAATAKPKALGA